MKAIITGASSSLGQVLSKRLVAHNWQVVPWERGAYPAGDWEIGTAFLESEEPQAIFHLAFAAESTGLEDESWLVNVEWTRWLASQAAELEALFIFTSSVMVWTDAATGPFIPENDTDAVEGYGYEKRQAELAALEANPDTVITRLGWQIGHTAGGRHMLDHIEKQIAEHGKLSASQAWYPACSFLEDTAAALLRLAAMPGDVYLLDANERWNYFEIAQALKELHNKDWLIESDGDFIYDQRMLDPRSQMPALSRRLPLHKP
ncbi:MAG: sugar nucleotide-binding protein [Chloroflexi bacterium]|nr:sugar nucleotide-binding protein [Chloroflexota bacterium]